MTPTVRLGFASLVAVVLAGGLVAVGCDTGPVAGTQQERLPDIRPNLPPVPNVPPSPYPINYDDGAWSVYGLRKRLRQTIEEEIRVKAFVVKIYEPPECPEGTTCPPRVMPHLWLGDDVNETKERRLLRVVGYADSQLDIDEAREAAEKALKSHQPLPDAAGLPPIVWDWQQGKQYIVKGRFTRASGAGFSYAEGLLEYMEHQCLDCPPPDAGP